MRGASDGTACEASVAQYAPRALAGMVVTIEGTICAGKTTLGKSLCRFLSSAGYDARFFEEDIDSAHLRRFMQDPAARAVEFQTDVMRRRNDIIDAAARWVIDSHGSGLALVDRGNVGDLVFMMVNCEVHKLPYASTLQYLSELLSRANKTLPPSAYLTLYLRTSRERAYARYLERVGPDREKFRYDVDYFERLEQTHDRCFRSVVRGVELNGDELVFDGATMISKSDLSGILRKLESKCLSLFNGAPTLS